MTSAVSEAAEDSLIGPVSRAPGEDFVRIRFAGDSGDGMQLTGTQFAAAAAEFGNDFATFPDYPAKFARRSAPPMASRPIPSISAAPR